MEEKLLYRDQEITISEDEYCDSPDHWGNTESFLVYDHRQFNIQRKFFEPQDIFDHCQTSKKFFYYGYYVFPVYAYIHSGVSLSLGRAEYPFTDRWDVSMKGFCLVQRIKGQWSKKIATKIAQSIVNDWNMYLSGDVWKYESEFGSCSGFYGEEGKQDMIAEAKAEIDHVLNERQRKIDELQLKLF